MNYEYIPLLNLLVGYTRKVRVPFKKRRHMFGEGWEEKFEKIRLIDAE